MSFGRMIKDGDVNENFEGVYEAGRIIVSENATEEEIFRAVATHEITHSIENTKYYGDIADFVIKQQFNGDTAEFEQAIKDKIALYKKNGVELDDKGARAELVASGAKQYIFADDVASIVEQDYTFGQKMHDYIGELIDNIKSKFGGTVSTSELERAQRKYRLALENARSKGLNFNGDNEFGYNVANFNAGNSLIRINMPEAERAEVLRNTVIEVVELESDNPMLSEEKILELENTYKSNAEKILKELCEKFGIFKDYRNENIELDFQYSNGSLHESVFKQNERNKEFLDFAKMLSAFDDLVTKAQPVETHTDKYIETEKENPNLKQVYVLVSAFYDGDYIIPVEFSIKEFKKGTKNKLYVSVTLQKKESQRLGDTYEVNSQSIPRPTLKYTIADLLKDVNPSNGDFFRYIPDELLDKDQLESKGHALEKDNRRLADMRYEYAVSDKGNTEKALGMLDEKRKQEGYAVDENNPDISRSEDGSSVKINGITYDDKGELIPLSKRYDRTVNDARFSFSDTSSPTRNYTDAQKKARNVIKEAIRNELNLKNNKLNNDLLDTFADNALDEIVSDYALSDESLDSIVNFMAERGTITDNDFAEMYPELKQDGLEVEMKLLLTFQIH